jgi:GlpG protein
VITAAFTNTAQYLISGPNFIGFSGVICAMLAFIWQRQKDAPWEGYQVQKSTFNFMMIFIFGMVALQSFAFALEAATGTTIPTSIANAAHVFGLGLGFILSKVPYFTKRPAQ